MYPRHCAVGIWLAALSLASASRALAQCPDGTPPPCRMASGGAPRVALDENLIAVFPFRVTGAAADAASLREGAMDLLALALDEQAGLRVVSSRTLLARARGFTDASPVADAAAIARSLGAGTMILGSAIVVGTQLRARAELHDVRSNRSISSVEARGTASDPAPIIDSLAAGLARQRLTNASSSHRSLQEFASTSPAALRAYLAGERLGRQGLWAEATDSLLAAIRIDSTFGLAYYRLSVAIRYGGAATFANANISDPAQTALRFRDRLPRRQRDLLNSVLATQAGALRDALAQADAIAAAYPDDAEAAFEQGEAYFHVGLALGEPPAQAARAFARAIALDSSLIEPYNHAAELLVVSGDTAGAWRISQRALAMAPTATVQQGTMMALRAIRGERPAATAAGMPLSLGLITRVVLEVVRMLSDDPVRALTLSEQFLALIGPDEAPGAREQARLARIQLLALRGRFAAAAAQLGRSTSAEGDAASNLRLDVSLLSGHALAPDSGLLADSFPVTAVSVAWSGVLRHDTALVRRAAGVLRSARPPLDMYGGALASCAEGRQALDRGDTAQARARLASIAEVRPFAGPSEIAAECLLLLARLRRAGGDLDGAWHLLGAANFFNLPFIRRADMEELRGQIAEQRGDTASAVHAYRAFAGLWENADPELQPRVAAARAALARLSPGR